MIQVSLKVRYDDGLANDTTDKYRPSRKLGYTSVSILVDTTVDTDAIITAVKYYRKLGCNVQSAIAYSINVLSVENA